jgi:acyl-CoA dehydrogenase family protein 9
MARFARQRIQFGKPIAEYEITQRKLATLAAETFAAEAMLSELTALVDRGESDYSMETACAKVFASDLIWRASDEMVQVAGGRGFVKPYPYERMLRDARINRIFEGTNEVLRTFIALAGIERLGDYLEHVGSALREPIKDIGVLTEFAFHRIKDAVGRPSAGVKVAEPLAGPLKAIERYAGALHEGAERAIRAHRERVVEEQLALARLADIAIDVYALTAVVGRVQSAIERAGEAAAEPEIDIARQFSREAGARIEARVAMLSENGDERLRRIARRPAVAR